MKTVPIRQSRAVRGTGIAPGTAPAGASLPRPISRCSHPHCYISHEHLQTIALLSLSKPTFRGLCFVGRTKTSRGQAGGRAAPAPAPLARAVLPQGLYLHAARDRAGAAVTPRRVTRSERRVLAPRRAETGRRSLSPGRSSAQAGGQAGEAGR